MPQGFHPGRNLGLPTHSAAAAAARPAHGRRRQSGVAANDVTASIAATPAAPFESLESRVMLSTYVVSTGGSDANAGSLAAPFLTIQRAADVAQAGDTVLIRGGTYRETVKPVRSGAAGKPITFKAYGSETVTVSGADVVSGWSNHRGSIYKASQGWDLGFGKNQVFVDGQAMVEARWPNTTVDVSRPVKATADAITATSSSGTLSDADLSHAAGAWNGATIHITAGQGWVGQTGTVTSSSPGKLSFAYARKSGYQHPTGGDPYYLTGKFVGLDAPSEWFRDPGTGQLYLWTPGSNDPGGGGHVVEAKRRQFAFDLKGRDFINVDGIDVFAATIVTSASSNDVNLNDVSAKYVSQFTLMPDGWHQPHEYGIALEGTHHSITNSVVAFSAGHGIVLSGANSRAENNVVRDVAYNGGDSAGIRTAGSGHVVSGNTVFNTGRSGIKISNSTAGKVTHNEIHDAMLQTTDGGGIYTYGIDGRGTEIAYNRIYNVRTEGFGGTGIMLDDNSNNYTVHHNVVWQTTQALKLNGAARNNRIYNNTLSGTDYSVTSSSGADFTGTVLKNNVFTKGLKLGTGASLQRNVVAGTDARFVDASRGNYQLQSSSPAVNAGGVIAPYTDGYVGAAPDAGAYEYGRASFAAGARLNTGAPVVQPPVVQPPPVVPPPVVQPPATAAKFSARSLIQAEAFTAGSGVLRTATNVGYIDNNDWVKYAAVDFGAGVSTFTASLTVSDRSAGQRIEVRVGGTSGRLLGTLVPRSTGGWNNMEFQSAPVASATGVQDLYLVFKGTTGVAVVDALKFA